MSKIRINSILKTKTEVIKNEFMGIIIDNKIVYNDDKINVTLLLYKDKLLMKRETSEYCINFEFLNNNTTESVYNVKKQNMIIYLNVKTKYLKIEDNQIFLEYELYQDNELFETVILELKYEVIK